MDSVIRILEPGPEEPLRWGKVSSAQRSSRVKPRQEIPPRIEKPDNGIDRVIPWPAELDDVSDWTDHDEVVLTTIPALPPLEHKIAVHRMVTIGSDLRFDPLVQRFRPISAPGMAKPR